MTRISGDDGNIAYTNTAHASVARQWNASFPRAVADVSGFEDTVARARGGIIGVSGSWSGTPKYDDALTRPSAYAPYPGDLTGADDPPQQLTLTAAEGCTYVISKAAIAGVALASDKIAAAEVSFDFVTVDGSTFVETWAEA